MSDIDNICACGKPANYLDITHNIWHCEMCDPDELAWILAHIEEDRDGEWQVLLESLC
jgi:hypothetical protein